MSRRRTFVHTGKNSELPREVFSRPAANRPRVLPFSSGNCAAGLSSGTKPVAVAVRSDRRPADVDRASCRGPVDDTHDPYFWLDMTAIVLIGCGTVGLLTAVLI